jgi:hypothetical protein
METVATLAELTDVGVAYNMSHMQLSRTLANVGMSLEEFQALTQRYAVVMSSLGIPRFNALIDEVQSLQKNFNTFGLTAAEGAEWAAEYLNMQRSLGNFSVYNQRNLNEAIRSNVERLTAYSKILNVSRSELQDAQTKASQNAMVQARFFAMSGELAGKAEDAYLDVIAQLTARNEGDGAIATLFEEMFAYDNIAQSPAYQRARATGAQGFVNVLEDMHEAVSSGVKPGLDMYARLGTEITSNKDMLYQIAKSDEGLAADLTNYLAYGRRFEESLSKGTFAATGSVNPLVSVTAKLNENLKKLTETFLHLGAVITDKIIKLIGGPGVDGTMSGGMEAIANAAGRAAAFLMDIADGKVKWKELFAKVGTLIWDGVKGGFMGVIGWLGDLIRGAIDDLIDTINNWSPFGGNDRPTPREMGLTRGSRGLAAWNLNDARKKLQASEANLAAQETRAANFPDNQGVVNRRDELRSEVETNRLLVEKLEKIYKEMQRNTEEIAAGNG